MKNDVEQRYIHLRIGDWHVVNEFDKDRFILKNKEQSRIVHKSEFTEDKLCYTCYSYGPWSGNRCMTCRHYTDY